MQKSFSKALSGYEKFRKKYAAGDQSVMNKLADFGQQPEIMVVACCDSRVDPALILQCDPGELFVVRNVANLVPPYEKDDLHHGTSAALEFGIRYLQVNHLILLGHSQCSGVRSRIDHKFAEQNDFISNWVSLIKVKEKNKITEFDIDQCTKLSLKDSYENCLTFPWIKERFLANQLMIHLWFFDIKTGQISSYSDDADEYHLL